MIRAALAFTLALAGPVGATDCAAVWSDLSTRLADSLPLRGRVAATEGEWCVFTDVVLDWPGDYTPDAHLDRLRLRGTGLDWLLDAAPVPDRLEAKIEGLRLVVQTGNPQMDYLFAAQARANPIKAELALSWDAAAKEVLIERLNIDFPGRNLVQLSARIAGVDLSTSAGMQMAATGFAVTEADLAVQTHGLFEWYLLTSLGPMLLPYEGDMDAAVAGLKAEAATAVLALPPDTFADASKSALTALIAELPNPAGVLTLSLRSGAGVGPARLMGYAMTGVPTTMEEAAPLFDGVRIDIGWSHEDAE